MRVYDAAFRCAGLLRVFDLDELFAAAETLARRSTLSGGRLAILTNGGGVGVLAVDRLADLGGELAAISPETMKKLDDALPPIWSHANPADIAGDAGADRYAVALECLLEDDANDAVLVMNVPTALASALDAAKSVIAVAERARDKRMPPKPVFTMWMGESGPASEAFEAANIPNYTTESAAVYGFMHLVRHRQARDLLMATPPSMPTDFAPDRAVVRPVLDGARARNAHGSIRSKLPRCSWLIPSRSRRPCWRAIRTRRLRRPGRIWPKAHQSSSKSNPSISCTNRKSAACGSISPAKTPCARPRATF
jgi:acetyltransferase